MQDSRFIWSGEISELSEYEVEVEGRPRQINSPFGPALEFDGEKDGLSFTMNPLAGLEQFTVEALFRPAQCGAVEQRFLHIGETHGDRLLFETRIVDHRFWYLDTFLSSGANSMALLNEDFLHPLGEWYHAAMICTGSWIANFVNHQPELSSPFPFNPICGGRIAMGMRQNRVSWFKGGIASIRITSRVLAPRDFIGAGR